MADPLDDTIMEEREDHMISPTGGDPTLRTAHFLKPSFTSINGAVHDLPSDSLFFPFTDSDPKPPNLKVSFAGWRLPQKNWNTWVDHMHSLHQSTWRNAGIHEAMMNSTYRIQRNDNLVLGFAERWSFETNTFVFPWGEATVTLEDMMILGGFPVTGDSVFSPVETQEQEIIVEQLNQARLEIARCKCKKANHALWFTKFMDSGSEIEHEAFLALWLCRFVFPTFHDTMDKCVFPIAARIAKGTKLALASAVLATIYRDLGLLKKTLAFSNNLRGNEGDNDVLALTLCAPLQFVQLWVWERFLTLRPNPETVENGEPRLGRWDNKKVNIIDIRSAIDDASESFYWRPFVMAANNKLCRRFYKEKQDYVLVNPCLDGELESFARCLRTCELVGIDSIEQYLPHRVAMQFGMDQDLPGYVPRSNVDRELAWKFYTRPVVDARLYFPPRLFESDVTTRYLEWWNRSMGKDGKTKAVGTMKSNSTSSRSPMPQSNKANHRCPGFPPKSCRTEASGYISDRKLTIAEFVSNLQTKKIKPGKRGLMRDPPSSLAKNGNVEKVTVVKSGPEMEGTEKDTGDADVTISGTLTCSSNENGDSSNFDMHETPEVELGYRVSMLEKIFALIKAAKQDYKLGYDMKLAICRMVNERPGSSCWCNCNYAYQGEDWGLLTKWMNIPRAFRSSRKGVI